MTTTTVSRESIIEALVAADLDEDALREGYSGRGMFGDECFGIVGSERDAFKFFVALAQDDSDLAEKLAENATSDSMGRSAIFYFPRYSLDGESLDD